MTYAIFVAPGCFSCCPSSGSSVFYTSELQGQLPHLLVHLMLSVGATESHHEHLVAIVHQALHSCYGLGADHLFDLHHIVPVHCHSGVPVLLQDPGAFRLWFWHWVHGLCSLLSRFLGLGGGGAGGVLQELAPPDPCGSSPISLLSRD